MNRFQARRATLEDLPQLRTLWEMEGLAVPALEKRFTEFQVAVDAQGQVAAALGLAVHEGQGCLHSEGIGWPEEGDELRGLLWRRVEASARSQGLSRLWTALESPFWKGLGFKKIAGQGLDALPDAFQQSEAAWLTFPLRAGGAAEDVDKQFAVLKALSQSENDRLMERARLMKWIAMGLMLAVFGAFAVWVVSWARVRARLKKKQNQGW